MNTQTNTSKLTIPAEVKLQAIAMKYYQNMGWEPQVGDLYTLVRNDNQVFEVVDIKPAPRKNGTKSVAYEIHIRTRTNHQDEPTIFPLLGFTNGDFGKYRVYIHPSLHDKLEQPDA